MLGRSSNIPSNRRTLIERRFQLRQLRGIPTRLLQLDGLLHAIIGPEGALEHDCDDAEETR